MDATQKQYGLIKQLLRERVVTNSYHLDLADRPGLTMAMASQLISKLKECRPV